MRSALEVMTDLAQSGLTAEQVALVMELSATVAAEARPFEDKQALRRRERDRAYQAERRQNRQTSADSDDQPSPQSPPLKSTPDPVKITPPLTPQPIAELRATSLFPPPVGVEKDQWRAFRQQRKKALTDRAYLMICNKLTNLAEAGWPPGEMIDLAIERGWETVFEPKDQSNGRSQASVGSIRGPRPDPTLELVRSARAAQREDRGDYGQARPALPSG